jgi:hypothetical protein
VLTFSQASTNFGLINRSYDTDAQLNHAIHLITAISRTSNRSNDSDGDEAATGLTQWKRFAHKVRMLNSEAALGGQSARYKVLFLARHGEGYHNVAEAFYGTPMWDVCFQVSLVFCISFISRHHCECSNYCHTPCSAAVSLNEAA